MTDSPPDGSATYLLHGLRVRSEVPLDSVVAGRAPAAGGGDPEVEVSWAPPVAIPSEPAPGKLLAALELGDEGYAVTETAEGVRLRFFGLCEFRISADRRSITVALDPSGEEGLVPILLAGNVMALLLSLQGECVLHASAVELEGSTIAIVGASGNGKSTVAALFCAAGARLVSDDLLRVVPGPRDVTHCFAGTSAIRLRPGAAELAGEFPPGASVETPDGRLGIRPPAATAPRLELTGMVIPSPSREVEELIVARLSPREALERLISYPRVIGWKELEPVGAHFQVLAEVARRTPVVTATIPWGPPFGAGLPAALLEALADA